MVPLMEKGNLIPRWIVLYLFFRVALKIITFRNLVNLSLEWLIDEPFMRAFFAFQVYITSGAGFLSRVMNRPFSWRRLGIILATAARPLTPASPLAIAKRQAAHCRRFDE